MNTQILEEAADWLIELNTGEADTETCKRFDTWLRTSPEHVRAYLELLPAWETGPDLPADKTVNVEQLIALGRDADNIVSLGTAVPDRAPANAGMPAAAPRALTRRLAIAATFFVALCASVLWYTAFYGVYTTGIGEQRTVQLDDGSTIHLNAASKVRVRYRSSQRGVELLTGQALFKVAHDAARPFIVAADDTRVRAVGTQFDVYRKASGTVVTVLEGKVAVAYPGPKTEPAGATTSSQILAQETEIPVVAGEQLTVTPTSVAKPKTTDVANATAWTQGRLVFDASTLGEVVREFNRYNNRQLRLRDRSLEALPITAAFSSPDPVPLIRFLKTQPGIHIEESSDEIIIAPQ